MKIAVAVICAALAGVGACAAAPPLPTRLSIVYYPQGVGQPGAHRYLLRCNAAAGTVPDPALACRTLARLAKPFAPTPPGTTCTDIALGPDEATVTGTLHGMPVTAHLTVRGGCEIERWRRVAAVVPGFPGRP